MGREKGRGARCFLRPNGDCGDFRGTATPTQPNKGTHGTHGNDPTNREGRERREETLSRVFASFAVRSVPCVSLVSSVGRRSPGLPEIPVWAVGYGFRTTLPNCPAFSSRSWASRMRSRGSTVSTTTLSWPERTIARASWRSCGMPMVEPRMESCFQKRSRTSASTRGPVVEADVRLLFWKQLSILGSTMGIPQDLQDALAMVRSGQLKVVVDTVLPLDRIREAHERLEKAGQFGKVVLKP